MAISQMGGPLREPPATHPRRQGHLHNRSDSLASANINIEVRLRSGLGFGSEAVDPERDSGQRQCPGRCQICNRRKWA